MADTCQEIGPPSLLYTAMEARAVIELGSLFMTLPMLRFNPRGDGHPVVVFPGFGMGDWSTVPLRWFLKDRNYRVHGWELGHNTGYNPKVGRLMSARLIGLFEKFGRRVSLVGWSLGGIYARELARWRPDLVRFVITLGSPFTHTATGTRLRKFYEFISKTKLDELGSELFCKMQSPPPVPTTSIYTRTDGVAAYRCCIEENSEKTENIEVRGSHCGLIHNPIVFWIIADRLSQPEEKWKPFSNASLKNILFRLPPKKNVKEAIG